MRALLIVLNLMRPVVEAVAKEGAKEGHLLSPPSPVSMFFAAFHPFGTPGLGRELHTPALLNDLSPHAAPTAFQCLKNVRVALPSGSSRRAVCSLLGPCFSGSKKIVLSV